MQDLADFVLDKPDWTFDDFKIFMDPLIVERKKIKSFKKVAPILSDWIMKDTGRIAMNDEEREKMKKLSVNLCGFCHGISETKEMVKSKEDAVSLMNEEIVPKEIQDKILKALEIV